MGDAGWTGPSMRPRSCGTPILAPLAVPALPLAHHAAARDLHSECARRRKLPGPTLQRAHAREPTAAAAAATAALPTAARCRSPAPLPQAAAQRRASGRRTRASARSASTASLTSPPAWASCSTRSGAGASGWRRARFVPCPATPGTTKRATSGGATTASSADVSHLGDAAGGSTGWCALGTGLVMPPALLPLA